MSQEEVQSNNGAPTMTSTKSKYVKAWEGSLCGQRQGQPVFISKLEGYRSSSAPETIAANWPPVMQIIRLISQDHMNKEQYVGKADFLVFRAMNPHGFLGQLQEKKLCAVIQLPSQTLLLSVSDKVCRLVGMLFPGDMVVFEPSSQEQQLMQWHQQPQSQQQHLPQLQQQQQLLHFQQQQQQVQQQQLTQLQQQLSQLQHAHLQQQQLTQLQQQHLTHLQQQLLQLHLTQQQHTQLQQQLSQLLPQLQQLQQLVRGLGQSQLVSQGQVSSQGSINIGGEGAS